MKYIAYKIKGYTSVYDPETEEVKETLILSKVEMPWSEANEEIAKAEAYNGEYTIEDDGIEEVSEPTQLDKIEAQVTYNSMILGTLIEEV